MTTRVNLLCGVISRRGAAVDVQSNHPVPPWVADDTIDWFILKVEHCTCNIWESQLFSEVLPGRVVVEPEVGRRHLGEPGAPAHLLPFQEG